MRERLDLHGRVSVKNLKTLRFLYMNPDIGDVLTGHKGHTVKTPEGEFEGRAKYGWRSSHARVRLAVDQPSRVTVEGSALVSWMRVIRFTSEMESTAYRIEDEDDVGYSISLRAHLPVDRAHRTSTNDAPFNSKPIQ